MRQTLRACTAIKLNRQLASCLCVLFTLRAGAVGATGTALGTAGTPDRWGSIGVQTTRVVGTRLPTGAADDKRTLQITVWYPAVPDSGRRQTYGDYFDLTASELTAASESTLTAAREKYFAFMTAHGVTREALDSWFASPMGAVADAAPAKQHHPLVVIAQGNGQSAVDQCSLAESLVGYGFVVATCPSSTRVFPLKDESELGRCAEQQADDIAMLVGQVSKRKDVDASRIGVIGHSLGARGALFFAMREHKVRVLISLDGGIGTLTGRTVMEASASFTWRAMAAKVFHFYETLDAFMKPDFSLLLDLSGQPVQVARVPDMHHQHFTSLGAWVGTVPGLLDATHGVPASDDRDGNGAGLREAQRDRAKYS